MHQQGFSLIEALASLLLLTTLALSLMQQQGYSKQVLKHLILRVHAFQFQERKYERLYHYFSLGKMA